MVWTFPEDVVFQFTHPGKGATLKQMTPIEIDLMFQFTHPGKGATRIYVYTGAGYTVSIHAPWEGCDVLLDADRGALDEFQFTHPGKGATCHKNSLSLSHI